MIRLGLTLGAFTFALSCLFHLSDPPRYVVYDRETFKPFYMGLSYKGEWVKGFYVAGNDTQAVLHTCKNDYILVKSFSLVYTDDNCS